MANKRSPMRKDEFPRTKEWVKYISPFPMKQAVGWYWTLFPELLPKSESTTSTGYTVTIQIK